MKKYIVRNKKTNEVFGKFDTKEEAGKHLLLHLNEHLSDFKTTEFLSPFDFDIQEEEVQDLNTYIGACEYLGLSEEEVKDFDYIFVRNKKHTKALRALSKLFTIAEAWNKEDEFVPDFSNENQYKYFPWFVYKKEVAGFVCAYTVWTATNAAAVVGTRLCFATHERAFDFGKKFEGLYNDFLLT